MRRRIHRRVSGHSRATGAEFRAGDWARAEYVLEGTYRGPLAGPGGQALPATNKKVRMRICNVVRFEGGTIAEEIGYFDFLGLLSQLGVFPGR